MFLTQPQAGDSIASQGFEAFSPRTRPFRSPSYGDGWQPRGMFNENFQGAEESSPNYMYGGGGNQYPYFLEGPGSQAGLWPAFGDLTPVFPDIVFELPAPFQQGSFSGGTTVLSGNPSTNSLCVFTDRFDGVNAPDSCSPTGIQDSANLDLLVENGGDPLELVANLRIESNQVRFRKITGFRLRLRRDTVTNGIATDHDLYLEAYVSGEDTTLPSVPCE